MRVMKTAAGWIAAAPMLMAVACGGADFSSEGLFDDASAGVGGHDGGTATDDDGAPASGAGAQGGEAGAGAGGPVGVGAGGSAGGPGDGGAQGSVVSSSGSGGAPPACGPATCSGCCDLSGVCQPGASDDACGVAGGACATCEDACGAPGAMIANGTYCGTQSNPAPAVLWNTCQAGSCEPYTDASGSWGACCSFQQTCEAGVCES